MEHRKLQYIFNVLMKQGILRLDFDKDEKGNLINGRYTIVGPDPFYIENKEWYRMQQEYDNFYPPVELSGNDMWEEDSGQS